MHPILFKWGPVTLYTYGLFAAIGLFVAFVFAFKRAKEMHLDEKVVGDLTFVLFLSGIIGARLWYVWQHWDDYRVSPLRILSIQEGGLVWYGGFMFATLAGILIARRKGWPVFKLADLFAPVLPLAHAFGRIGCFFNGCCYGADGHPVQLYEAGALFVLTAALFRLSKVRQREASLFLEYIVGYSVIRFVVEFYRGDQSRAAILTLPQWTSLCLLAGALTVLIFRNRSQTR
jgi:phosphatidylglycerol:prolipoprotein diacylglycerol transferase